MRVETNERLARRNRQLAQYLFFATFGILILGLLFINQQATTVTEDTVMTVTLLQAAVLPIAFITTIVSVRMTNLWVRQPRPEVAIRDGLKGMSNRSVLYSYYHFPARHVLIAPQGVFAMVTRFQEGHFTVEENRWKARKSIAGRIFSIFRFDSVGNPSDDALRAAAHVQKLLQPIAPDIEVHPLVVFVDPRAEVVAIKPSVPVVFPSGKRAPLLKDVLKDYSKDKNMPLTPEQIEAFEAATL